MKKLVLTGAAGRLGSYLREPLTKLADELVSTDIAEDIGTLYPGESYVQADLADLDAMIDVLKDADMVVHFGAIGDEAPFEQILGPNIIGAHNVWEAAYRNGVKRVVYASSVHAVGMHKIADNIGIDAPHRPDTFYGLAKCFAEDLGRLYWDKRGVESVHMRIFSCAQVVAPRSLSTWLSYDDLIRMVTAAITAQTVGFSIVYGISNNDRAPVHNTGAGHIGYKPQDNAEQFAEAILADAPPADPTDLAQMTIGGPFATIPLGESGVAKMTIVDDAKKT
ncbi:MAG: NAD(P)-dependent oxidoreductase [Shimia sp.]|uniref:NAD-dependent epimerase/dehydratase family protein n=1 Tax=Shimia sp. TaxID=1954381 RepID=UPI0019DB2FCC|nr:NAD(P)-dependent oxidoreductase [Shimia sp.]MBE1291710.1 NAD-dependent epimerase/dehydratase family protein [Paracoccaceae bacterium]MBO6897935.1 NAD(P)-dependent oxidoreductase [Shimia sp.]